MLALRPDPRELSPRDHLAVTLPTRRPLSTVLAHPPVRMAVLTIAVAQVAMVAIMGISTIAYRQQGMSLAVISFVLSGHFSGMFAFSPVWGAFLDRRGRKEGLLSAGANRCRRGHHLLRS